MQCYHMLDFCELRSCCDDDSAAVHRGRREKKMACGRILLSFWRLLWPLGRGYIFSTHGEVDEIISWAKMGASPATRSVSSHFVAGLIPSSRYGRSRHQPESKSRFFYLMVFFSPARMNRGGRPSVGALYIHTELYGTF